MSILGDLRRIGLIGINERNVRLIAALNPRRLHHLVDDKAKTKRIALAAGIPVPELYGSIANTFELRTLRKLLSEHQDFVIKPAMGSQGNGILVITDTLRSGWRLSSGRRIEFDDLHFHVNNILSGMFSLGGQPDKALIEYRVQFDPLFNDVAFRGVPDLRVIVLHGVPAMAMARLPTAQSDGKANLHKGGIGVCIDIDTGVTSHAMQGSYPVTEHPDTGHALNGIAIPNWDEILSMSSRAYDITGLGYIGVDAVLDRVRGPLLLELNARPGLAIQIANRRGLRFSIDGILARHAELKTVEDRVAFAKDLARSNREAVAA